MKLSKIRNIGRFTDTQTGKSFNVKKGVWMQRGTDHLFYLLRGKRMLIQQSEFYSGRYKEISY